MDIDLLWAIGGWLILLLPANCMATLKSSSSSSSLFQTPTAKPHPFLLFLGLLFVLLVLVHSADPLKPSMAAAGPVPSASSPMNLHRKNSHKSHTSSSSSTTSTPPSARWKFEAGAHEVPSGPNPISNRLAVWEKELKGSGGVRSELCFALLWV
ncbi:CLAVATA3/ESR (CLE)-related protein TDIF-like [Diospyros lotus]|uniref:CLAVATA3/ESR (CLE)-related protein TDIF-like n=1 Tax=Diospyros lotus TaxID=55363 RepID=UPI0022570AE4|nr:CLAVATA3/ESR (CLE)-related protein TDIF-like [Diospyros lotus]